MGMRSTSTFGKLLQQHRELAHLTQEELAARTGVSKQAISNLERGANRAPRADTIKRLATGLQLVASDQAQFEAAARGRDHVSAHQPLGSPPRLPIASNSFVGRRQ